MPKKLSVVAQTCTKNLTSYLNEGIIYSGDIFKRGNYLQWRYFQTREFQTRELSTVEIFQTRELSTVEIFPNVEIPYRGDIPECGNTDLIRCF